MSARAYRIADAGAVGGDVHHVNLLKIGDLEIETGGVGTQNLSEHGDDGVFLLADVVIGAENRAHDQEHQHDDHDALQRFLQIGLIPARRHSGAASRRRAANIPKLPVPELAALKAFEIRHMQPSYGSVFRILPYCEKKDKKNRPRRPVRIQSSRWIEREDKVQSTERIRGEAA